MNGSVFKMNESLIQIKYYIRVFMPAEATEINGSLVDQEGG